MPYSLFIFLCLSSFILSANAQSSFELMCRNQAKEIAADTYKNCVTEQRQNQIEGIRNEYQQKLSDLKSHYDGELKKLSPGSGKTTSKTVKKQKASTSKRASGARELPEKDSAPVMDFTSDNVNLKPSDENMQTSSDSSEITEVPVTE
jgi:Skp family chaperone for outer membrane proteins